MSIQNSESKIGFRSSFIDHTNICISCVYFGLPNEVFVSSAYDRSVKIWKIGKDKPLKTLTHSNNVNHVFKWNNDTLITISLETEIFAFSLSEVLKEEAKNTGVEENRARGKASYVEEGISGCQVLRIGEDKLIAAFWDMEDYDTSYFNIFTFKDNEFKIHKKIRNFSMMDETKMLASINFKNCLYFNDGGSKIHLLNYETEKYLKFDMESLASENIDEIPTIELFRNQRKEEILIFGDKISVYFCNLGKSCKFSDIKIMKSQTHHHKLNFRNKPVQPYTLRCYLNRLLFIGGEKGGLGVMDLNDFSLIEKHDKSNESDDTYHRETIYDLRVIVDPEIEDAMKINGELGRSVKLEKVHFLTACADRDLRLFYVDGLDIKIDAIDSLAKEDLDDRISFLKLDVDLFSTKNEVKFFDVIMMNVRIDGLLKILFT